MDSLWTAYFKENPTLLASKDLLWDKQYGITFYSIVKDYFDYIKSDGHVTICELGCGSGTNLILLNHLFPNALVTGIDMNSSSFEHCIRCMPHWCFIKADLTDFHYGMLPPQDILLMCGILIHLTLQEVKSLLVNIKAICKPTTFIFVCEYTGKEVKVPWRNTYLFKHNIPLLFDEAGFSPCKQTTLLYEG